MMKYWKYYDNNFKWENQDNSDFDHTIDLLTQNGISKENAVKLFDSGYVCILGSEVLIDRFYGGPIASFDLRTRFPASEAHKLLADLPCSPVGVTKVKSIEEVHSVIASISAPRGLVFRGQNQNHPVRRAINNPYLTIENYGEISLMPSLWRKMYSINPNYLHGFRTLSLLEWSSIFYDVFDMKEIERRDLALFEAGEIISTMSDMEDCSDELLSEFGKFRKDLAMGLNFNLATTMTTLLQHYGLMSPVLDLTESLNVALFFATHQYEKIEGLSNYSFIGSNNRQAVIYVLDYTKYEMERHDSENDILKYLHPQRPIAQKCVICNTNQYSINLPAHYLRHVIVLDFDIPDNISGLNQQDILPGESNDRFLKALSKKLFKKEFITHFDNNDL